MICFVKNNYYICNPVKSGKLNHNIFLVLIMPTIQQLVRTGRTQITKKSKSVALDSCPQRRGVCTRVYTTTPKKPNSAMRKVARVRLTNGIVTWAYPVSSSLSFVWVLGLFAVVRGALDTSGVAGRTQRRSKYGAKRPKEAKK